MLSKLPIQSAQLYEFELKIFFLISIYVCVFLCVPLKAVISSEAVTSGGAVVQQPLIHTQTALITTATTLPATQVRYYYLTLLFHCCVLLAIVFLFLRALSLNRLRSWENHNQLLPANLQHQALNTSSSNTVSLDVFSVIRLRIYFHANSCPNQEFASNPH